LNGLAGHAHFFHQALLDVCTFVLLGLLCVCVSCPACYVCTSGLQFHEFVTRTFELFKLRFHYKKDTTDERLSVSDKQ